MGAPHVLANPPKVALIGGGFIGPVHAEALRRIGVQVAGLLDISPERARPLAERSGIPKVYNTLDELLGDPSISAVHIASPNHVHFEHAKRALEAGKHVLCEKPLAISSKETAELVKLAASRPKQAAGVNYNIRFYPALPGDARRGSPAATWAGSSRSPGSYTQDWLLLVDDYNWRVEPDGHTNLRAVSDIGTHWMDLAQFVTGLHIEEVNADLATFHPERKKPIGGAETFSGPGGKKATETVKIVTEDYGAVLLHLSGGTRGVFHVMQMHGGRKNRLYLEVCGTEGSMVWDSESPEYLWMGRRGGPNSLMNRDPALLSPEVGETSHYPGGHAEGLPRRLQAA